MRRSPPHAPSPTVLVRLVAFGAALAGVGAGIADARAADDAPAVSPAASPAVALAIWPAALSFDRAGDARAVTVRNVGDAPVSIDAVKIVPVVDAGELDFSVNVGGGQRLIAPGEEVAVTVVYRPLSPSRTQSFAALRIDYEDAGRSSSRSPPPKPPRPGLAPPSVTGPPARRTGSVALRAGGGRDLLSWLIFSPLFGIPILFLWPRGRERALRLVALAATAVPFVLAAWVVATFDLGAGAGAGAARGNFGFQLVQHVAWIRALNVEYHVGVDGLSVGLVGLTALISVIAVLASSAIPGARNPRAYFALLLLLETGMLGVFLALDLFLFYVFWELVLLPMFFLIGLWGGPRKDYAAIKFFLYTLLGSVLILLAIIALYYGSRPTLLVDGTAAAHTLDLGKLARANDFATNPTLLGFRFANLVWVLLFIGFAIKIPVVPVHTWLPDAHVEAPTAVSVILAGVLLKMGTYGLLRVSWAVLPEATRCGTPAVAALGALGVVYGAFAALAQTDLKRLVAYSSISHLGYCLLGMAALTPLGIEGAVYQMISHGVVSALLFLLVGVLYDRTGERGLDAFGGVATVMPRYAAVFALGFFASLGLPGLSGFIGEVMALLGTFGRFPVATVAATLGLVIAAAYNLLAIRRIQFGVLPERWRTILTGHDLDAREWASLLPLAVLTIVLGIYPAPVLGAVTAGVASLLSVMGLPPGVGGAGLPGRGRETAVLSNAASLGPFAPEIILALGALVVLGAGLIFPRAPRHLAIGLTLAALAAAGVTTWATSGAPPRGLFGGLIARDPFADFFKLLFALAGAIVALASARSRDTIDAADAGAVAGPPDAPVAGDARPGGGAVVGPRDRDGGVGGDRAAPELGALILSVVLGACLMAASTDLLTAYLSLEFVSILSYVLTGFSRRSRRAAEAALKYAIYGGAATGAMLYGFSLLFGLGASSDFAMIRAAAAGAHPLVVATAIALCLAGFGFKMAVVPFHMWCPDVYEGAPTPIAAFFSVVPKAAGFALAYRFLLGGSPARWVDAAGRASPWAIVVVAIAAATMTLGNLAALSQRNLKRLLAYSSIAHAGTIAMALAVGTDAAARAMLTYLGVYLFMSLAAFLALIAVAERGLGETLDDFAGLARRAPLVAFCFTVALFSLTGLPPLGGFVAKYALFAVVVERGLDGGGKVFFLLALLGVLNTVVSLGVTARVVRVMYFGSVTGPPIRIANVHTGLLLGTTMPVVLLGVYLPPLSALVARSVALWPGR